MLTFFRSLGVVVLLAVILLLLAMRFPDYLVNILAFHPHRGTTPAVALEDPHTREVNIVTTDGVRLQALHRRHPSAERLVLFFHGNAGNIYGRLPDMLQLSDVTASDVLLLSYRGYGESEGSPSESGVYRDAEAALRYALNELGYPENRIFVLGRSLGSAVAIDLAQNRDFAGLILVSPFTSGRDMATQIGLGWLSWVTGRPFDSITKTSNIRSPALFIHGDADTLIPIQLGRRLYDAYPSDRKEFKVVPGAGHNDITAVAGPEYWEWMRGFMEGWFTR